MPHGASTLLRLCKLPESNGIDLHRAPFPQAHAARASTSTLC